MYKTPFLVREWDLATKLQDNTRGIMGGRGLGGVCDHINGLYLIKKKNGVEGMGEGRALGELCIETQQVTIIALTIDPRLVFGGIKRA